MVREDGRWWIKDRTTGERYSSSLADQPPGNEDLGYLSRRIDADRVIVHIAGIQSPGSRGVVSYLAQHLAELHATAGTGAYSLAVRCKLDGLTVTGSDLFLGPKSW